MNKDSKPRRFAGKFRFRGNRWLALAALAIIVAVGAGLLYRWQSEPQAQRGNTEPIVNLFTLVGKRAPSFTLSDSEGRRFSVETASGRPYFLIFHMGSV